MPNRWLAVALATLLMTGLAPAAPQEKPEKPAPNGKSEKPEKPAKEAPKADAPGDDALKEAALKLNALTSADAMKAKLTELYKDKDAAKQLVKVAAKALKDGGAKDPPFKYNAAIVLGNLAILVKDWEAAEGFYTFCFDNAEKLQSGKKMLESYKVLVEVLNERKKFDKAEELTKRVLDGGGKEAEEQQGAIMEKLILTLAKGGNTDEAIDKVDSLIAAMDGDKERKDKFLWYLIKLKAEVYREGDKLDEAIAQYLDAIAKVRAAKAFKKAEREAEARVMEYTLSGVYVDNKQVDKSVEVLEKLMKANPDSSTFYNDLGYILADNGKRLDEAETMVRKAMTLDAELRKKLLEDGAITDDIAKLENSAYLDSLGWVLFKRGKYEEAYKYLDKASQDPDEGNHIEIWDHVADCLVKLDKKKEAVAVWTKALKLVDASKRDIDRRKKVEAKLKAVQADLAK